MPPLPYDPAQLDVARQTLTDLGVSPKQSLSQNFLLDEGVLDRTVEAAQVQNGDTVLEIGPGLGALTVRLLATGARVVTIEKDRVFAAFLRNKLRGPQFSLVENDVLDVQLGDLELPASGVKIVANLPYAISKPLLRRLLEEWRPQLSSATVLLQREVGDRLIGRPGTRDYGPMSIMASLYSRAERCFDVPPEAFLPPPNVVSSVIHLEFLSQPSIELQNERFFWQVVRAAFAQRRKTLGNTLKSVAPRETLAPIFERLQIDPQRRGETLSLREFADLSAALEAGS